MLVPSTFITKICQSPPWEEVKAILLPENKGVAVGVGVGVDVGVGIGVRVGIGDGV